MKRKDIQKELSELRAGDGGKAKDEIEALKKEQFNLRFQRATGQLEKPSRIREVRRMIARAKTVQREKAAPKAAQ
ncbi:MAG: 50S ribosomal protein L29 [Hyphomonadaceae bacterium]|nr:50S ribosomal protein L29 [Hyphomonadaceae bacterium]